MSKLNPRLYIGLLILSSLLILDIINMIFFNFFSISNIAPNILIIPAASAGFLLGKRYGIIIGFFSGLIYDLNSLGIIGYGMLIFMIIGYLNGYLQRILFMDRYRLSLLLIGISNFFYGVLTYVFFFLLRGRIGIGFYIRRIIIHECIYTILVAIIIYPILRIVYNKIDDILGFLSKKEGSKRFTVNNL